MTIGNGWGGQSVVDKLRRVLVYDRSTEMSTSLGRRSAISDPSITNGSARRACEFRQILTDFGAEV